MSMKKALILSALALSMSACYRPQHLTVVIDGKVSLDLGNQSPFFAAQVCEIDITSDTCHVSIGRDSRTAVKTATGAAAGYLLGVGGLW